MISHSKHVTVAENMKVYNIKQLEKSSSKSNLLGQIEAVVESFREEDELFIKTKSYNAAVERLQADFIVTIAGGPGYGKTALALHLLLEYEENGYEPLLIDDPKDFKELIDVGNKKKKQIVLIDDAFGSTCIDTSKVNSWVPFLHKKERLVRKREGKLLIVITSRKYILTDVEKQGRNPICLKPLNIVDMTSDALKLSFGERDRILCTYLEKYKIAKESLDTLKILEAQCPHGFPHCVKLFCSNIKLRDRGEQFFENPMEFVLAEIEQFAVNDRHKYCILLMILLMGFMLNEDTLNEFRSRTDETRRILRIAGLQDDMPFTFLKDALHALNGIYIKEKKKDSGEFVFSHESISDAVSFSFTKRYPAEAISTMSLKFVIERTCLPGEAIRKKEVFEMSSKLMMPLARRFTSEILRRKIKICFDHKAWSDTNFIETWLNYIKTIDVLQSNDGNETGVKEEASQSTKNVLKTRDEYLIDRTLLPIATFAGHEKLVTALLQDPTLLAEIDLNKNQLSLTLVSACYRGFSNLLLERLIEMGADINYKDKGKVFEKYYDIEPTDPDVLSVEGFLSYALDEDIAYLIANGYCSPLSAAVTKGNLESVEFLLNRGVFVLSMSTNGKTIFHIGAEVGSVDVLKCLLQHASTQEFHGESHDVVMRSLGMQNFPEDKPGVILDDRFRVPEGRVDKKHLKYFLNKETFWHFGKVPPIFMTSKPEIIQLLVEKGADINHKSWSFGSHGVTLLMYMAQNGTLTIPILQTLFRCGADLNATDLIGKNVLHYLIKNKHGNENLCDVVDWLLQYDVDVNKADGKGRTPLMRCVNHLPMLRLVRIFLSYGAEVNKEDRHGTTALHYCAKKNLLVPEIWQLLLNRGGNIDKKDKEGKSPLFYATRRETPKMMAEAGADLSVTDQNGHNAFLNAISRDKSVQYLQQLKAIGVDVHAVDTLGRNAISLYFSRLNERRLKKDTLVFLLQEGIDVNCADKEGRMPLHHLIASIPEMRYRENKEGSSLLCDCLNTLISMGATANAKDNLGITPLMLLLKDTLFPLDVLELLLEKGAVADSQDKEGMTPLHHCLSNVLMNSASKRMASQLQGETDTFNPFDVLPFLLNPKGISDSKCSISGNPYKENIKKDTFCPLDAIKLALEKGSDSGSDDAEDTNPLHGLSKVVNTVKRNVLSKRMGCQQSGKIHGKLNTKNDTDFRLAVLGILLQHKADVNSADRQNRSPLVTAVRNGCTISEIGLLLSVGADVTVQDQEGQTLIHHCLYSGLFDDEKVELVQFLFEKNQTFFKCHLKLTNFCYNILLSCPKTAKFLISQGLEMQYSESLLREIAYKIEKEEETSVLKTLELLFPGGFVGLETCKNKSKPLTHVSLHHRKLQVLKYLLENKFDMNVVDEEGNTILHGIFVPFHNADGETSKKELTDDQSAEILSVVCENGIDVVDVNARNCRTETPLMLACMTENLKPQSVFKLLEAGANPALVDIRGKTPLHLLLDAAEKYQSKKLNKIVDIFIDSLNRDEPMDMSVLSCIVLYLTSYGSNVSQKDCDGNTPLVAALSINPFQFDIVNQLIDSGADLNNIDSQGNTVLHFIVQTQFGDEIVAAAVCKMIEKGADLFKKNKSNLKAIDIAVTHMYPPRLHTCLQLLQHDETTDLPLDHLQVMLHHSAMHSMAPDDVGFFLCLVQHLQLFGLDVNNRYLLNNTTYLMNAVDVLNIRLVSGLLSLGADPNLVDVDGYTALHYVLFSSALFQEWYRISVILKQDPDYDIDEQTLLQGPWNMPSKEWRSRITKPIMSLNIMCGTTWEDVEHCKESKIYHLANAVLQLLLSHAADANIKDTFGKSPLQYAVEVPVHDLFACKAITTLVEGGASVNDRDLAGRTPLLTCLTHKGDRSDRVTILLKRQADILVRDNSGRGVMYYTDQANRRRYLESLVKQTKHFPVDKLTEAIQRAFELSRPDSDEETGFSCSIQDLKASLDP